MLLSEVVEVGTAVSLSIVAGILLVGVVASWLRPIPEGAAAAQKGRV
jgi:hypothetical protein